MQATSHTDLDNRSNQNEQENIIGNCLKVLTYESSMKGEWNDFVRNAKNSHFFFIRNYMEYHSDRFKDNSLLIYNDKEKLIALLPANRVETTLYSHQGLTFGGLIVSDSMKVVTMLEIFDALKIYFKNNGITKLIYKALPYIHHIKPAEEDRYALFRNNATKICCEVNATITLDEPVKYSHGRKWSINKAKTEGMSLEESREFSSFWKLLEQVLNEQHGAKPVHNLAEIEMLANAFPKNIKLFTASKNGELLAGAVIYENKKIAHLQYVANGELGRQIGALDLLIDHLIQVEYKDKKYFNFGISNEQCGRVLNDGLIDQKERFGARAVAYDTYEWIID